MDPSILKDDPHSGYGDQIDDIRIGSLVAMRIMAKRENCPNKVFTHLNQLDDIPGFGQDKLNDLVYSLKPKSKKSSFQDTATPRNVLQPSIPGKEGTPPIDPPSNPPVALLADFPDDSSDHSPAEENGSFKLEDKDIGNLEKVLRTYYLSQIKSLDGRKNRKLARELIEDHLVLPESQQRTSKDLAYIKEKLQIEGFLLKRLEDTRLIRKISRRGNNPIFEVSHDSLVEPILKERRRKEAIAAFWKNKGWALLFLLPLFFLFGWCSNPSSPHIQDQINLGNLLVEWQKGNTQSVSIKIPDTLKGNSIFADQLSLDLKMNPYVVIDTPTARGEISVEFFDTIYINAADLQNHRVGSEFPFIPIQKRVPFSLRSNQKIRSLQANVMGFLKVIVRDTTTVIPQLAEINDPIIVPLKNKTIDVGYNGSFLQMKDSVELSTLLSEEPADQVLKKLLGKRKLQLNMQIRANPPIYREFNGPIMMGGITYSKPQKTPDLYIRPDDWRNFSRSSGSTLRQNPGIHTVSTGETLYSIAKKYDISVLELRALNRLQSNEIIPGDRLRVKN